MRRLLLGIVLVSITTVGAFPQNSEVQSLEFALGGAAASVDEDPAFGGYLATRLPAGDLSAWGLDFEGLWSPEGVGDYFAAGQGVVEWPLHSRVQMPKNLGMWLGARAGLLLEVDRTESSSSSDIETNVEAYPTAGLIVTGVWSVAPRFGLESRLTIDTLSATRLAFGIGVRIQ